MKSPFVVYITLVLFNFTASIVQGVTGFGDAVLLQMLWYAATIVSPDIFNHTPLGDDSVRAITLLMYVRILFSAPIVALLSLKGGAFSKKMAIAMAIPSLIFAVGGVFIFTAVDGRTLKLVLGYSCLTFAGLYFIALLSSALRKHPRVRRLLRRHPSARLLSANVATNVSCRDAHSAQTPQSAAAMQIACVECANCSLSHDVCTREESHAHCADVSDACLSSTPMRQSDDADSHRVTHDGGGGIYPDFPPVASPSRVSLSGEGGCDISTPLSEAGTLHPPSQNSAAGGGVAGVVRNRNFDEHGKIRTSTKICAGVASALSGVMGSLTGVGAPPQIIFILLLDVPNSIMRVNFCIASLPSAAFRFILACSKPLLTVEMIPMLVTSVLSGYAGIYLGYKLGQIFGPRSYSVFVLLLLIVASLIMMTTNLIILFSSMALMVLATTITAVYERRHASAGTAAALPLSANLNKELLACSDDTGDGGATPVLRTTPLDKVRGQDEAEMAASSVHLRTNSELHVVDTHTGL